MIDPLFLLRMPKVELHVHLEGTMRPDTLLQLAGRRHVDLPVSSEEGLGQWFLFRDFEHFVEVYLTCSRCLRDPEDFQLLVADFLAEQARQNILYSEVHFTISTHIQNGGNGGEIGHAMAEAMAEGEARHGVRMRLIPDIVRNLGPRVADLTLEWALDHRSHGVIALGLSGIEAGFPNEPYREHFAVAKKEGLRRVAHAGEHAGPESIRSVLAVCGAERIGHGVRAAEDPALLEELRAGAIPLEVCPTSNVKLGVFPTLAEHSFGRLRRSGVPLSVNSDDPALFGTTLTDEYLRLHETFGYSPQELANLALAAVEQSFLPETSRMELEQIFRRQLSELAPDVLQ